MSYNDTPMTDGELAAIQARVDAVWPGPWQSFVEGRDMLAGSSLIRIADGEDHADIWMAPTWMDHGDGPYRLPGPQERQVWFEAHYDFVACARQDIPRLLAEVRSDSRCTTTFDVALRRRTAAPRRWAAPRRDPSPLIQR